MQLRMREVVKALPPSTVPTTSGKYSQSDIRFEWNQVLAGLFGNLKSEFQTVCWNIDYDVQTLLVE